VPRRWRCGLTPPSSGQLLASQQLPLTSDVSGHRLMLRRRTALLVGLASGLVVGLGYPYLDLAAACRIPDSEACVWGKAYFPLTLGLSLVLLGGTTAGLVYPALSWRGKNRRGDDGP
jgi:hypothetical protein